MRRTIARARADDGMVMVVVMGVLLVLAILSAGLVTTATSTTQGGRARSASDRAIAAAQEGLQTAIYRLNTAAPKSIGNDQCPPADTADGKSDATRLAATAYPQPTGAAISLCGPYTSSTALFAGKTGSTKWTFWISPVLGTVVNGATVADTCTANPVSTVVSSQRLATRCVTAQGWALGPDGRQLATRRVQARVAASISLFPIPGIFGTACLGIGGQARSCSGSGGGTGSVNGSIGSNGQVDAAIATWCCGYPPDTPTPGDVYLGPGAPAPMYNNKATPPGRTIRTGDDIQLPDMVELFKDPGKALRSASTDPPFLGGYLTQNPGGLDVAAYNDNATPGRITFAPTCQNNGSTTGYIASKRSLVVVGKANNDFCTVTIDDGLYDFCAIDMSRGNSAIVVRDTNAATAEVKIFIDSPARDVAANVPVGSPGVTAGAACPPGSSGNVANTTGQANAFLANAPTSLGGQVFVYGDPTNPSQHFYDLNNGGRYNGLLFASNSFVSIKNNGTFVGGLAAHKVSLQNGTGFQWDPGVALVEATTGRTYYRTHWTECRTAPPLASDPTSGC